MAAKQEPGQQGNKDDNAPRSPYAVLVELEGAAVHARRAEYEALRSLLGEQKMDVSVALFARHCVNTSPSVYVPVLVEALKAKKQVSDKLAGEIKSGITLFLSSPEADLVSAAEKLMAAAHQRHMDVALLTGEKEAVAKTLVGRWGNTHGRTKVFAYEPGSKPYPRADAWLKVAKSLSRTPRQCVVLAGSSYSAKTALSAGMRCIAMPDEFTLFQDFSGVDAVVEPGEQGNAAELLDLIAPPKPFI